MVLVSDGYENFLKTRYSSEQWGHYYLIPLTMILYMLCCHVITLAKSIPDLQFHTSTSKITARIFTTFHAFLSSIKSGKYLLKSIPCLPSISVRGRPTLAQTSPANARMTKSMSLFSSSWMMWR